jgi:plastocyanin
MRLPARRSLPLICLLCLFGGGSAAIAASGQRSSRERHSHAARACHRHRAKHRHCPASHGAKSHHKPTRGSLAKPSAPGGTTTGTGSSGASSAPWTAAPAPVIPGSTAPGSGGTHSGSPGSGAPTETPAAPTGPAHVQVTAEDTSGYHFILSRTSVPAGSVVLEFVNHGQDEHNLHAVEPAEGAEAGGLKENVKPDAHTDLTLNLHAGSYTLFCSLPHHEEKGMKATLKVE